MAADDETITQLLSLLRDNIDERWSNPEEKDKTLFNDTVSLTRLLLEVSGDERARNRDARDAELTDAVSNAVQEILLPMAAAVMPQLQRHQPPPANAPEDGEI